MKRLLLATMLSLSAFAASAQSVAVDVRAQASASALDSVDAQAQVQTQVQTQAQADAKPVAASRSNDPNCVTQTGSHLQSRHRNGCVANGRSYSRDDLDRTGQVDVGEALRRLDPRLR